MTDITSADLLPFCSPDRHRSYLSTPFVIGDGGFTYASNGHMAVRVPGRLTDIDQMKNVPSIVGLFEAVEEVEYRPFEIVTAEDAKLNFCETCRGTCYVIDCHVCEASGTHTCADDACGCEHDCGACRGRGVFRARKSEEGARYCDDCDATGRVPDKRGVTLGPGLAVQWRYLRKVQALPGPISWSVPEPEPDKYDPKRLNYGPVAFMGCGWIAVILPLRTDGREAIVAIRLGYDQSPTDPHHGGKISA